MRTFVVVWLGQVVSLVGSGLTSFALSLWVYQHTGSATQFALLALAGVLPTIILSPFAGVLVDRWDRRRVMILSDAGAGLGTLAVALLFAAGQLETWHIYVVAALNATFGAFQAPAYLAATTLLVPKSQLGRANGLLQLGPAAADILAPMLAGMLVVNIGVPGVVLIDFATFIAAVGTLLLVRFPALPAADKDTPDAVRGEVTYGLRYILARPGLLGLLAFLAVAQFAGGTVGALLAPMVLGFTTADWLGLLVSIAGSGMLLGGLAMSVWGGPKRRIKGVLGFEFVKGLSFVLMGLRPSVLLTTLGAFGAHFTLPIVGACNQAIWQGKVAPGVQGRVFAARQMIARAATPLAFLLMGPLADNVFEPLLAVDGPLSGSVGQIIGAGAGRGMSLIFILMGLLIMLAVAVGSLYPRLRRVEDELPDADAVSEPAAGRRHVLQSQH
ncbi:MAG: MFS transporter [Anaerolineae bacterium]|nr:MFS transporter [Anaerolineae bacterium]